MKTETEQVLARFHLLSTDRHHDEPVYEWLVHTAHRQGLQGATVLRGILGITSDGALVRERNWSVTHRVPIVVEVVDSSKSVTRLLEHVEPHLPSCVVTLERAHVVIYRHSEDPAQTSAPARVVDSRDQSAATEVVTMAHRDDGVLLRVFIGESDEEPAGGRPLYQAIVDRAREARLAGATVLKGPLGFGKHSHVHAARLLDVSTDLPIVIEIVDREDRINDFLPVVDELVTEGLVTLEAVQILRYNGTKS